MNKHFEDTTYYARRAGRHLYRGLREELAPVEYRIRRATGYEKETPTRTEKWRAELREAEWEAQRRARRAMRRARERV
ncbi:MULTISPECIES: DUF7553 family protein [Halorussus]|uniref:DUF7553 family protein n=1 Tax=Halorussus TaxID=1070314 RepID=UPI00209D3D47|nr:hypothetical protein [Halorussus vallis]USZ76786.1 hypothetical protein NGM07_05530 [Halorussus vallis]